MEIAARVTQKLMESPVCLYLFGEPVEDDGTDLVTISNNIANNRYENIDQWCDDLTSMINNSIDTSNEYHILLANYFKQLVMKEMKIAKNYKSWIKRCEQIYEKLNMTMLRSPNVDADFTDDRITATPYEISELQSVFGVVHDPGQVAQISQILRQTGELKPRGGAATVDLMTISSLSARRLRDYAVSLGKLV